MSKKINLERERHGTQNTLYIAQKNVKTFSLKLKGTLGRTAMPQPKSQPVQIQMGGQGAPDRMSPLEKQTTKQDKHAYLMCVVWLGEFSALSDSNIGEEVVHACVLVTQLCLTLCDSTDCSLPGSSVHGIFQARILEWVAMPFSWGSSQPRD